MTTGQFDAPILESLLYGTSSGFANVQESNLVAFQEEAGGEFLLRLV